MNLTRLGAYKTWRLQSSTYRLQSIKLPSTRYNRMGNMQDLEDAIEHTQAVVNKIP